MQNSGGEEPDFESLTSVKTVPAQDSGTNNKSESEFRSVVQTQQTYSFRKKVNLKLPKIDELVADEGLPSVTHKFQAGESAFSIRREQSPKDKDSSKIKRVADNEKSPVIEAENIGVDIRQGLFLEEAIALAAKDDGMDRRPSDLKRWHTQLDEEEKRQLNKDIQMIKEKLKNSSSKRKNIQTVEASAYHTYTLCCCCLKFGQTKNAYMCILINDVILSANLTLYGLISTLDWRYFITPLVFFMCSTITYLAWRVNQEQFSMFNKLYNWIRYIIFLVINIPFVLLLIKVLQAVSDIRRASVGYISENLSPSEKVFLSLLSLNNVYVLIVIAVFIIVYNLINLFWCCQMTKLLRDAFEFQERREQVIQAILKEEVSAAANNPKSRVDASAAGAAPKDTAQAAANESQFLRRNMLRVGSSMEVVSEHSRPGQYDGNASPEMYASLTSVVAAPSNRNQRLP